MKFFTILFVGFVGYLGIALVYPIFAVFLFDPKNPFLEEGTSAATRGAILGLLIGLTPLTQFFSSPLLGKLSDLFGRKRSLLCGTAIGCLGYLLAFVGIKSGSLSLLFLYRFCIGVSEGNIAVAQAAIADMSSQQEKAKRFAFFNASLGTGFTLGPFIGGKLADPSISVWCGYITPFVFAGLLSFINLLFVFWKLPNDQRCPEERSPEESSGSRTMFQWMNQLKKVCLCSILRYLFLGTFVFAFGWSFYSEFMPLFLQARFAFSSSGMGNFYAYGGLWYALNAALLIMPVLKKYAPEKIIIKALLGCAGTMLLMLAIDNSLFLWALVPLLTYCTSLISPTLITLISNNSDPHSQGESLGLYQSVVAMAMGISPLIIGPCVGLYPDLTILGGAVAMLFAGLLLWIGLKTTPVIETQFVPPISQ